MIFPPFILCMFIFQTARLPFFKGYLRANFLASGNLFRIMALFLTFASLSLLFLILLYPPFLRSIIQVIAMNFSLSDVQTLIQQSAKRIAESELAPLAEKLDQQGDRSAFLTNLKILAENGFMGVNINELLRLH